MPIDQRFYASTYGRFNTADPSTANVEYPNPISWNLYAYVDGDPVGSSDPDGLGFWSTVWSGLKAAGSAIGSVGQSALGLESQRIAANPDRPDRAGDEVDTPTFQATGYASAPCPAPTTGFGIGVLAGASAEAGVAVAGASAQGSIGGGAFINGSLQPSLGTFASWGVAANAGSNVVGTPQQASPTGVIGAFAGYGPGVFATHAGSAQQLGGPFWTATANIGIGVGQATLSIGLSPGVWMLAVTAGPAPISAGIGVSVSAITTNTAAAGTSRCP